jgi:hypothetical protein
MGRRTRSVALSAADAARLAASIVSLDREVRHALKVERQMDSRTLAPRLALANRALRERHAVSRLVAVRRANDLRPTTEPAIVLSTVVPNGPNALTANFSVGVAA